MLPLKIKRTTNILKDSNGSVNNSNLSESNSQHPQQEKEALLQSNNKDGLALLATDQTQSDKSVQCSFNVWVSSSDEEIFTEEGSRFAMSPLQDPPNKEREAEAERDRDSDSESNAESTERHMGDLISKEAETLLATKQMLTLENSELSRDVRCLSDQVEVLKNQNQCLSEELEELKSENSRLNFECGVLSRRTSFQMTPPLRPYSPPDATSQHSIEKVFEERVEEQNSNNRETPFKLDLKKEILKKKMEFPEWTLTGAISRGLRSSKESAFTCIRDLLELQLGKM
jgi:hypothetical protein